MTPSHNDCLARPSGATRVRCCAISPLAARSARARSWVAPWRRDARPRGSVCDQLAIVPGLAFDRQGFRLGYGGGFYDTFLSGFAGIAAGLCREALAVDDLAAAGVLDAHDQACDLVLTDARTLRP